MNPCADDKSLIEKQTLYPGSKYIPFVDGTRVCARMAFAYVDKIVLFIAFVCDFR